MNAFRHRQFLGWVILFGLTLAGCGFLKIPSLAPQSQPLAPIIGEPCLVRVQTKNLTFVQGSANPLNPPGEQTADKGLRFIAVGFPIGASQTLAIDDYELLDDPANSDDPQVPFAVGGEGPGAPEFFYESEYFSEKVALTKGTQERTGLEGQGSDEDAMLISWETPSPVVLLLFEIPDGVKTVTLRHGSRKFVLEPDTGLIDGKPGAGK